jgi:hypothetical protein
MTSVRLGPADTMQNVSGPFVHATTVQGMDSCCGMQPFLGGEISPESECKWGLRKSRGGKKGFRAHFSPTYH